MASEPEGKEDKSGRRGSVLSKISKAAPLQGLVAYPPHNIEWRTDAYSGHCAPVMMFTSKVLVAGILIVKVLRGESLYKTHSFGKPDPYVQVEINEVSRKTEVCKGKDRDERPSWDTVLQFDLKGGEKIVSITAWNKKRLGDDLIGKCSCPLPWLLQLARPTIVDPKAMEKDLEKTRSAKEPDPTHTAWFLLGRDKGQKMYAGQILLSATFIPHHDQSAALLHAQPPPESAASKSLKAKYKTQPENLLADIRKGSNLKQLPAHVRLATGQLKIFGGDLKLSIALSKYEVPKVVYDTIKYLKSTAMQVEGLFRIPGNNEEMLRLKNAYDRHIDVGFTNPHDAGGVLKLYLRELPTPLVPFTHYEFFLRVCSSPADKQIEDYRILLASIPPENRTLLGYLFSFLFDLSQHADKNKMNLDNIAIVFAPNILRPEKDSKEDAMVNMEKCHKSIKYMMEHHETLFPKQEGKAERHLDPENEEALSPLEEIQLLQDAVQRLEAQLKKLGVTPCTEEKGPGEMPHPSPRHAPSQEMHIPAVSSFQMRQSDEKSGPPIRLGVPPAVLEKSASKGALITKPGTPVRPHAPPMSAGMTPPPTLSSAMAAVPPNYSPPPPGPPPDSPMPPPPSPSHLPISPHPIPFRLPVRVPPPPPPMSPGAMPSPPLPPSTLSPPVPPTSLPPPG